MKFQFGNIKKIVSLSVHFEGDHTSIEAVVIKFSKGEIELLKSAGGFQNMQEVIKKFGHQLPYILHCSGKGILNRVVDQSENYKQSVLLNANPADFYFTDYTQGNKVYASVVRRTVMDEWVEALKAEKATVISISSGPFLIMAIAPYLNKSVLDTRFYSLTVEADQLKNFAKQDEPKRSFYQVGTGSADEKNVSSIAHGVLTFSENPIFSLPKNDAIFKVNKEEAKQKVIFSQFGFFMLIFFLMVLLGNYIYLGHLNKVFSENTFLLAEYDEEFNQINELEEEKTRKEILLRTSGVLSRKYISFYLAEISNTVPRAISFSRFTVKPLKKEIKQKLKIEIDNQLIFVKGTTKSPSHLSDWILELKAFEWVRKVEIEDYNYSKGLGEFNIRIVI